ncbi:CBU_0592 family membrane protein [Thermoactinospora rubra]|uniref:CBU_0592 family membrane protein n=1 Tax=Thermoactinospora rubra TaxID=1088767 RepID=UPI00117C98C2|nr:hypothetical protein [Thermoactinospora rubra]
MDLFLTVIGWLGAGLLLFGYAMVSSGRMSGDGVPYQLVNLAGAAGLMVNSAYQGAWPSAILNVVWGAIGLVALARLARPKAAA